MRTDHSAYIIERLNEFLTTPLEQILREHASADACKHATRLAAMAMEHIPAYRQFLIDREILPDPAKRLSFADFQNLPLIDKSNYMQVYPLPQRCKDGQLSQCDRLAVSSGSTGIPTFWPRAMTDELPIALRFEQIFRYSFYADQRSTLAVVCFPMGNWVGGVFTASCCWYLAQKGYPLTVATPGNKVDEILRVVRELGPHYQQTVLLGYPPFVRDVMETGSRQGIDWQAFQIRFVFAGEVFSEEWRSLMYQYAGVTDYCHGSASLYGTADGGVLGQETPTSIAIRRFLASHPAVAHLLFGEARLPTLVQYDPHSRFFEQWDGTLVVTGDNGIPLIRYHLADRGGLLEYPAMMHFLTEHGLTSLNEYGLNEAEAACTLPFVWVFGRTDFTVSFYGANIYPENVTVGLEQHDLNAWVTGKFVMQVHHDADGGEYLQVTVELAPGQTADSAKSEHLSATIAEQLRRLNSEFSHYVPAEKQCPVIALRNSGDPEYFPVGVKHRYTRR